ncbi:MAG: hypothetical protein CMN00_08695 [Rickettsiales bacterium]|nr:hypothetical protein [Rickettsiales bacterium]|tara:strand:- start:2453 stop:3136 length:684 start_codon:yes stop_codon:yes gene_type:complete
MNSIYLFCGGNKNYPNGKSKPLQKFADGNELILDNYRHIEKYFDKITYVVEHDEIDLYKEILSKSNLDAQILKVKNETSTLQKLRNACDLMDEEYASFSYPDIFCSKNFWSISKDKDFTISRVSISSRFPRIYSDIFTNVVKGISNYQSRVPANPHYIFGGKFDFNVEQLKKFIIDFKIENKNLEIDFLDELALKKTIHLKTIFEEWFNIDSDRDYSNMMKLYGKDT